MLGGCVATIFTVWFVHRTQKFAERNPELAMLEGAELLEYRKFEMQVAGQPPEKNPILSDVKPAKQLLTSKTDAA